MNLRNQAVAEFLSSRNTIRDGSLVGLALRQGEAEWDKVLHLTFSVPRGIEGDMYELVLWDELKFDYHFCSETTPEQIAFVKCLWTDQESFYLSLDPWKESERFPTDQDNDCFWSKSAMLTIIRSGV